MKLTKNEIEMLIEIQDCQHDDETNINDFSGCTALTNKQKGILGSLVKKELAYDCSDYDDEPSFNTTEKGTRIARSLLVGNAFKTIRKFVELSFHGYGNPLRIVRIN